MSKPGAKGVGHFDEGYWAGSGLGVVALLGGCLGSEFVGGRIISPLLVGERRFERLASGCSDSFYWLGPPRATSFGHRGTGLAEILIRQGTQSPILLGYRKLLFYLRGLCKATWTCDLIYIYIYI